MGHVKGNPERWMNELMQVDDEIARLACLLDLAMVLPGGLERVVNGDAVVRDAQGATFQRLRHLVALHFRIENKAIGDVGPGMTQGILTMVFADLHAKYGRLAGRR